LPTEEETEAQFVARLVAGDESASNELVLTYERRVFALVFRMLAPGATRRRGVLAA
jgi:RNA polymerase sigma-70 factor (ECF subfamily)